MNKLFLVTAFLLLNYNLKAQSETSSTKSDWYFGFGLNLVDNTSTVNSQYFNLNQMNFGNIISNISVEYKPSNWGFVSEINYNKISSNVMQNGAFSETESYFLSLDMNAKLYVLDSDVSKNDNLEIAFIGGFGINKFRTDFNGTVNAGLSLQYWIKNDIAIKLQTVGKFAFEKSHTLNNHILHSIALVVKI